MRQKLIVSLSLIAAILLVSSIISVMEYSSMSNYVSTLIAGNINSVNVSRNLSESVNKYNLDVLSVIGDDKLTGIPDFDRKSFVKDCEELKSALPATYAVTMVENVMYAYSAYMLASIELTEVLKSDFVDTRTWYFERLQPLYNRLQDNINQMSEALYNDLRKNSATFERGFYRSIIPGIVAVGVGLVLIFMLMFFVTVYYVNPIYRMLASLSNYKSYGKPYNIEFEGDDQLHSLNENIREIADENRQLRRRLLALRNRREGSS